MNVASKLEQYPIPHVEDLFTIVSGGKFFTKLNMSHLYQQIELDNAFKQFIVINTHKGLFRYNRLSFEVFLALAISFRVMESLLQEIPGVPSQSFQKLECYDGKTEKAHLEVQEQVLDRLEKVSL